MNLWCFSLVGVGGGGGVGGWGVGLSICLLLHNQAMSLGLVRQDVSKQDKRIWPRATGLVLWQADGHKGETLTAVLMTLRTLIEGSHIQTDQTDRLCSTTPNCPRPWPEPWNLGYPEGSS